MIKYQQGNLFEHLRDSDVIVHICNDIDLFDAGFARALSERLPLSKKCYHDWFQQYIDYAYRNTNQGSGRPTLGDIQVIDLYLYWELREAVQLGTAKLTEETKPQYEQVVTVVNMIAQRGVRSESNPKPINYEALDKCLSRIPEYINENQRIVMPKIGTGLAGGDWDIISKSIEGHLQNYHVVVFLN